MSKVNSGLKKRCIGAIAFILVLGFGADICRLFYFQVIKSDEYRIQAEAQQLSDTVISADRGVIYDANMNVLAESASAWLVYVNPSKIKDDAQAQLIADGLSKIFTELTSESILKKLSYRSYSYVKIAGGVEYNEKTAVINFRSENELGEIIGVDPDTKRYYPFGNFASTVLGMTNTENNGRAGIELMYNDVLMGTPGRIITAKDAQSGLMQSNYETIFEAEQGTSLVLTLDKTIQYALEKGLMQAVVDNEAKSAYGIVMDVETGGILAMATMPDYDLNNPSVITDEAILEELSKITDEEEYDIAYNNAVYSMWRNQAISDTYEPGSVFKIFTAAAAIEEGVVNENSTYHCTGSIQVADNIIGCHNLSGHGTQTLAEGLMNSCNPFFITVGQNLGSEAFYKYFEAFGFTTSTGIDLPAEATPTAGVTYHAADGLGLPQLSSSAFGQTFQVSAIQMITAVSAIANGGKLMQPYLVAKKMDQDGNTIAETVPTVKRQVVSESTAETVLSMMEKVVSEGTGKNAYIPGYRVAGKTGTSEKLTVDGEYIASFVGCAPADDPQIAVLIIIDEPQGDVHGGGAIAAPVAGDIIEQTLKYMNVEPVYTDEELAKLNAYAPGVVNMTVEGAKNTLESQGFVVRVVGSGDSVVSQYPNANQNIPLNGVVVIYTEASVVNTTAEVPDLSGLTISEVNEKAVNSGFNIKISGTTVGGEVVSYKQSVDPGATAELGSTITVYFKTTTGVYD